MAFLEEVARYARELAGAAVVARKVARETSLDELRRARRALRRNGEAGLGIAPAEAALREALGAHRDLAAVTVRAGSHRVSFGGVPLGSLRAFARALARAELPRAW
jgi:hypothetical protein